MVLRAGFVAWGEPAGRLIAWVGEKWVPATGSSESGGSGNGTSLLGINATADAADRLAVSSAGTLLTHEGDDHRLAINRSDASDTASVVFQTDHSGRAEMGLAGDDARRAKVSADSASWFEALTVEPTGWVGAGTNAPLDALHVAAPRATLRIEETTASDANGGCRMTSVPDAGRDANALRLASAGTGIGTGGVIADLLKDAGGRARIALAGYSGAGAMVTLRQNLNS